MHKTFSIFINRLVAESLSQTGNVYTLLHKNRKLVLQTDLKSGLHDYLIRFIPPSLKKSKKKCIPGTVRMNKRRFESNVQKMTVARFKNKAKSGIVSLSSGRS